MKKLTVTVADAYRRARIGAAERGASASAAVRRFLIRWTGEETDFDRRKRLQDETLRAIKARSSLTGFRGGDRMPRHEIHGRGRPRLTR